VLRLGTTKNMNLESFI